MTASNTATVVGEQSRTNLVRRAEKSSAGEQLTLQERYWPPVTPFTEWDDEAAEFFAALPPERDRLLAERRADPETHGSYLHLLLAEVYAYCFGYRDAPATAEPDDALELALLSAKIRLEREMFDYWATPDPTPGLTDQRAVADYLDGLAATNPGVDHPLFHHLRDEATHEQLSRFLQYEVIRNEVVDDEVALLVVGLQGMQKNVAAANLWDEVGRGRLEHFHTYWLRQLIEASDGWEAFEAVRAEHPWYAKITSNTNAALLTRPAFKNMAYGCFLVFESWVEPHFRAILAGMDRLGILDEDIRIYFAAHVAIDPRHSRELSDGLRAQSPSLTETELQQILRGAHLAASAGRRQFDRMLQHLHAMSVTDSPLPASAR